MKRTLLTALILALPLLLNAQRLQLDNSSTILIKGTSTMHDWESTVEEVNGNMEVSLNGDQLTAIKALDFAVTVESIKSGKKKMDKLTYEAFDFEENPKISFKLTSVKKLEGNQAVVVGNLTMAGTTQEVEISGTCEYNDGAVKVTASHPINMVQFGMERPTAMLGAIKVGEEVIIDFTLNFK